MRPCYPTKLIEPGVSGIIDAMDKKRPVDQRRKIKNALRDADNALIRSGQARPIDIARRNSCFSGADLHAARSEKGFDLF